MRLQQTKKYGFCNQFLPRVSPVRSGMDRSNFVQGFIVGVMHGQLEDRGRVNGLAI